MLEKLLPISTGLIAWFVIQPTLNAPYYLAYHAAIQFSIFAVVAHIPCYRTGVMWWVDLAWPLGLDALALYNYFASRDDKPRESYKAELITFCLLF